MGTRNPNYAAIGSIPVTVVGVSTTASGLAQAPNGYTGFYVGGAGDIPIVTIDGRRVLISGAAAGSNLWISSKYIDNSVAGFTASLILGLN